MERIVDVLDRRAYSPRHRSYLLSYGDGERYFRTLAETLNEAERIDLVREFCKQPMTPVQVRAKVRQLVDRRKDPDGIHDGTHDGTQAAAA